MHCLLLWIREPLRVKAETLLVVRAQIVEKVFFGKDSAIQADREEIVDLKGIAHENKELTDRQALGNPPRRAMRLTVDPVSDAATAVHPVSEYRDRSAAKC
jgi:hypothetical protein